MKIKDKESNGSPIKAIAIAAIYRLLFKIATAKIEDSAMVETPAANPSKPSIRLIALVTPTIQRTVTT